MELTLRFLLLLKKLISSFRERWDQSARRLWYIFWFVQSCILPQSPKKRDEIRRNVEYRPAKPPTTVICASEYHGPPLTPIFGGDTPIWPPGSISIQVRQPTSTSPEDAVDEAHSDPARGFLSIDGYFLEGSRPISRSTDPPSHHEPEDIYIPLPPHQEDLGSHSPIIPSRPISQYSGRSSQYSYRPPSLQYSVHPSSPRRSASAPSAVSFVASQVYSASRPRTRASRRSSMGNSSQHQARSPSIRSLSQGSTGLSRRRGRSLSLVWARRIVDSVPRGRRPPKAQATDPAPAFSVPPKDRLRPMIAISRYEQHKKVVIEDKLHSHVCSPVTVEFVRGSAPGDWVPLIHPEGALYWAHGTEPIYTDTNMCDPDLRQGIEKFIEEINDLKDISPPIPTDWELVLELGKDDETGEPICSYYFVCHSTRCLFWLHGLNLESVLENLHGVTEYTHIHLALQSQYWSHWEAFPHNREVPDELLQELSGILLHAGVDCMTSTNSTTIYSDLELNKLLGYMSHIKQVGGNYGFSACVVGRLMNSFTHSRFANFYGQNGARLTNDQTIYGFQPKRTYLIKLLSIFLFYAPELHLRGLESVYTDFVVSQHRWVEFITKLQSEWAEFILYGTVLLNANMAFLSISSVDPGNHIRTPAQLASYLSVIASVGSVVTGLLLLRQHRAKPQEAADDVNKYLRSRYRNAFGFETLAILYSLPYSLLLWATMSFFTAFGLEVLLYSEESWARLPVGTLLAMVVLLIFWCVRTALEARAHFSLSSEAHALKDSLVGFTRRLRGEKSNLDAGGAGGGDQNKIWMFPLSQTLKKTFNRLRRPRRLRGLTPPATLDQTGSNGYAPQDGMVVEMGEISDGAPADAG